jgi:hypothetical protein
MSTIPLDLERTFERRWAARFSRVPARPQAHLPESHQPLAALAKKKRKTRQVKAVGFRAVTVK